MYCSNECKQQSGCVTLFGIDFQVQFKKFDTATVLTYFYAGFKISPAISVALKYSKHEQTCNF